jgi:hypothetical protein
MDDKDRAILDLYKCIDSFVWALSMQDPDLESDPCTKEIGDAYNLLKHYEPLINEINQAWPDSVCKCHPHDRVYYGCRCKMEMDSRRRGLEK